MNFVPDDVVVSSSDQRLADGKHEARFERLLQKTQNLLALRIVRQIADLRSANVGTARVRVLRLYTHTHTRKHLFDYVIEPVVMMKV